MSQIWTFQQLEGPPAERRELRLQGWNAPFGRPRKDPVIKEVIKSRIQTTRYPGADGQTRHAFGTNWEATELKGRWMTKSGEDTANDIAIDWINFIKDERTFRMSWGTIVSYTAYLEELELSRESEHEIAWRMKIQIDQQDEIPSRIPSIKVLVFPLDDVERQLGNWMAFSKKQLEPNLPDMSQDFFDELDSIIGALNAPAAELNKLAGEFDDIQKASYSQLQHLRGAVKGVTTAMLTLRDVALNASIDTITAVRTAESDIAWVKYQADLDVQTTILLDQLGRLERSAELAQNNEATAFVTAEEGDTWESLSMRVYATPEKAGSIRLLNGIRYGERPTVGESYLCQ